MSKAYRERRDILERAQRELRLARALGASAPVSSWILLVCIGLFVLLQLGVWRLSSTLPEASASYVHLTLLGASAHEFVQAQAWRLMVAPFLHFSPVHLMLNVVALGSLAALLERLIGGFRLWVVFVSGSLLGQILALAWFVPPLAGASAGLAALATCGLVTLLRFRQEVPPKIWKAFAVQAAVYLVVITLLSRGGKGHGGDLAHLGGVTTGFLLGVVLRPQPLLEESSSRVFRLLSTLFLGLAFFSGVMFARELVSCTSSPRAWTSCMPASAFPVEENSIEASGDAGDSRDSAMAVDEGEEDEHAATGSDASSQPSTGSVQNETR